METPVETWTVRVDADTASLQQELTAAAATGRQFSRAMTSVFQGVAFQGKSLGDTVRSLGLSLSQMTLRAAFKPMEQIAGNAIQSMLGGFGGSLGGGSAGPSPLPMPFAAGGVISSPIAFPLAGGASGIAGERGAEAIMPLARGPDGKLGIRADGGGGRSINVTFNVTTPDADSFRRTETQLAAMLSRAVSRGQRNL